MTSGRLLKYKTPEALQKKIDEYFDNPPNTRKIVKDGAVVEVPVYTISGLVLFLGFCDRASFFDYGHRELFSSTIKAARTRMALEYEKFLQSGLGSGAIFALKNFGWSDKQEIEHSGSMTLVDAIKKANIKEKK
ncbi:MAG: hypothetical protein DRP78_07160 [Candidatus Omnitrophota bacterium]|nr:MAG: hypothetical protein DRP78_07160 [Candidatus Omnitrophota bacterium]